MRPAPDATHPAAPQPATSQPSTPASPLDPQDPAAIWRGVLDAVGQSNAAAWMDHFRLQSIDTSVDPAVALIAPTMTFAGGAGNVATGPRLQRVADTITQLLGRSVRAELAANPQRHADQNSRPDSDSSAPGSAGGNAGGPPGGSHSGGSHSGGGGGGGIDRRDALNLPLVRDVFEIFPDASLINTRREKPQPPDDD